VAVYHNNGIDAIEAAVGDAVDEEVAFDDFNGDAVIQDLAAHGGQGERAHNTHTHVRATRRALPARHVPQDPGSLRPR
jgi:hypothetical protein